MKYPTRRREEFACRNILKGNARISRGQSSLSARHDISRPDESRQFSQAMERRIYEDTAVHVDIIGMKQERANACGEASRNMIFSCPGIDYEPATDADFSPRVIDRLGYSVLLIASATGNSWFHTSKRFANLHGFQCAVRAGGPAGRAQSVARRAVCCTMIFRACQRAPECRTA